MYRSNQPPTPVVQNLTSVVPVAKGGTGASNILDAANNLGGVHKSKLGAAGGLAQSDSSGNVPTSLFPTSSVLGPTLSGSSQLSVGQTATFQISNYDSSTTYTVTASGGVTPTVNGDTITYVAPGTAGSYTLTINGKVFNITVGVIRPAKPTLSVSTSGNGNAANLDMTSSAFAMLAGSGTHKSTDWEVYSDPNLVNLVKSSLEDTVNKTGWSATGLALNTTFYARVRYKDTNNQVSDWSSVVTATSASDYLPNAEEAKFTLPVTDQTNTTTENLFLQLVSVDSTGTRVAVGNYSGALSGGSTPAQGYVYIYKRIGTTWAKEATLAASDPASAAYFGESVSLDSTGTRIVVGAWSRAGTYTNQGAAYVFVRNTTTNVWTQEQKLVASDPSAANEYFGYSCAMSSDGARLAIGAHGKAGTYSNQGAIYVFTRSGTTWTQEAKLVSSDPVGNDYFGVTMAMAPDSSRIVTGAYNTTGGASTSGAVYVFRRSGTTWTQEQKILASDPASGAYFGSGVAIDGSGLRIAVGAQQNTASAVTNCGAVYIYVRSGNSWAQETKITASNKAASDNFGCSVSLSSNGDSLLVGAYKADVTSLTDAGAMYLYSRNTTTNVWTESSIVTASDKAASNGFGTSVAIVPDGSRCFSVATWRGNPYYLGTYVYS